jgi:septal ring factor EnvC (AmiA/AmiB activator)
MPAKGPFTHDGSDWSVDDKGNISVRVPEQRQSMTKAQVQRQIDRCKSRIDDIDAEIKRLSIDRKMIQSKCDDLTVLTANSKSPNPLGRT